MKKRTLLVAALIGGYSLQASAQQFLPKDVAGDNEYKKVCREYELKSANCIDLLNEYLDKHPDTRFRNRIEALVGASYFDKGKYKESIALLKFCDLDALPDNERDLFTLKLATAYLKEKDLNSAYKYFYLLKEISPRYRNEATFNIAYIEYANKNYDSALKGFEEVQEILPYNFTAPLYIGDIYLQKKNYGKAATTASSFLAKYPNTQESDEMERVAGEAAYYMRDYNKAVNSLNKYSTSVSNPSRNALYELGISYYNIGVYSKAAEELGKVTFENDDLSQNAYYNMGLAYLNLKDRNMARMAFEQASNLSFDKNIKEESFYNYALIIHETSYSPFAESVTVFEKFLNEYPNSLYAEKVNGYLVEVYMNTRSYKAALASIDKINHPGKTILEAKQRILFQLGTEAFINSNYEDAKTLLNQSLALGEYNKTTKADAYYWLGETYYKLDNYTLAINSFKNYLNISENPKSEEYGLALYNIGYCNFKQSKYNDASPWFNKFINSNSDSRLITRADAYNRLGDCAFFVRQLDGAEKYYATAASTENSIGDYSLFQEAFIKGLKKDYNGKIVTLNRVISDYPSSQYIDDAIYEQGRAFVQMEDNNNAIQRFNLLVDKFPNSNYARKAESEIALLYYQDNKYPEAIKSYKTVISKYPGSDEAKLAQRDLKNIYIDINQVNEYADFVSTIPGMSSIDNNERDSLTYVAAEKIYMRGNTLEAKNSFNNYLNSFQNGAFCVDANYNLGLIEYNEKKYNDAQTHLNNVLKYNSTKYTEEALIMMAAMASEKNDYNKALEYNELLQEKASSPERVVMAQTEVMRNAYKLNKEYDVINASTSLLHSSKLSPELINEAYYYRAKSYEKLNDYNKAKGDWAIIAKDTRNVFGAEAKYELAQINYNQGNYAEAEKEILNYIDVSTPHAYWLARGFVLLSDIYMKNNHKLEAKQYLLSLKQNYHENDDIAKMIETRLQLLKNVD